MKRRFKRFKILHFVVFEKNKCGFNKFHYHKK